MDYATVSNCISYIHITSHAWAHLQDATCKRIYWEWQSSNHRQAWQGPSAKVYLKNAGITSAWRWKQNLIKVLCAHTTVDSRWSSANSHCAELKLWKTNDRTMVTCFTIQNKIFMQDCQQNAHPTWSYNPIPLGWWKSLIIYSKQDRFHTCNLMRSDMRAKAFHLASRDFHCDHCELSQLLLHWPLQVIRQNATNDFYKASIKHFQSIER